MTQALDLRRDSYGHLVFTGADGVAHAGVTPVRAFPLSAPGEGLSLVNREGHEVCWIESLDEVAAEDRRLLDDALATREFMPVIEALEHVSTFATPSAWMVRTDRGRYEFVLRGEEDIRQLGGGKLLIADSHGIQFMVRDLNQLDRHSRKLLDRFL